MLVDVALDVAVSVDIANVAVFFETTGSKEVRNLYPLSIQ